MKSRLAQVLLVLFLVLIPLLCAAQTSKTERAKVLKLCETYFGPSIDGKLNLYEANSFYVLSVKFDAKDKLELLEVVPKYYFSESHPDWIDTKIFEYLSWTQYQNFVTRVDLIRPKGNLIERPPSITVVTNSTAPETSIYEHAKFTVGILVDIDEPEDAPARVKWFKVEFGKKAIIDSSLHPAGPCLRSGSIQEAVRVKLCDPSS